MLHFFNNLLRLQLLLDQSAPVLSDLLHLSSLGLINLARIILGEVLQLPTLFIFLAEDVNELIRVNILVHLKLLNLFFQLLESLRLLVLILVEALTVRLDLFHLLLQLLDDLLGS